MSINSKKERERHRENWKNIGDNISFQDYLKSINIDNPQSILDDMVEASKDPNALTPKQIKEAKQKHLYSCKRFMVSRFAKKSMAIQLQREKLNLVFDAATKINDLEEADRLLLLMKKLGTKEQMYTDRAKADYAKYFGKI